MWWCDGGADGDDDDDGDDGVGIMLMMTLQMMVLVVVVEEGDGSPPADAESGGKHLTGEEGEEIREPMEDKEAQRVGKTRRRVRSD
eukprot:74654-Hanusia_phi.AAC.3